MLMFPQSGWLMLETLALETIQKGQSKLSTQLIKPHYLVNLSTDAAPQFTKKLIPFRQTDRQTDCLTDDSKEQQTNPQIDTSRWKKENEDEQIMLSVAHQPVAPMKFHC